MDRDHIESIRLYEVVTNGAVFDRCEMEHLCGCDGCLEMIRVLVSQRLSKMSKVSLHEPL